jgi:hypothetical protein
MMISHSDGAMGRLIGRPIFASISAHGRIVKRLRRGEEVDIALHATELLSPVYCSTMSYL